MTNQKILSVVIPVYNEENTIRAILDKVAAVRIPACDLEIIIVNDGSKDNSDTLIREWINDGKTSYPVRYIQQVNQGKGAAVRTGIRNSTGDAVIVQDADLEYDPQDYAACVTPILAGECKVVYGYRAESNRGRIYSAPGFYLGGLALTFWVDLLFNANLTDEATCYKTFDGPLIRALEFEGNHFEWEPEITAKLLRLGYEIKEVPIAYYPRKSTEGKKIKFRDGIQGLGTALYWRFASLKQERCKVAAIDQESAAHIKQVKHAQLALLAVVLIAVLGRLIYSIYGIMDPELVSRIDTASYLGPARSLLENGVFASSPGAPPTASRLPLYPLYLAICLFISGGSLSFCVAISAILGGLIACPVYLAARLYGNWKIAFCAALLFALNPTAIALSPMLLSDTLFLFLISLQTLFFLKFARTRFSLFYFAAVFTAAVAVFIRPTNLLWLFPAIFVLWCMKKFNIRQKLLYTVLASLIYCVIILPWIFRNHALGAGYRIDVFQTDMIIHNVTAMESKRLGVPEPALREQYMKDFEAEFARNPEKYPTLASRLDYQEKKMKEKILAHPFQYAALYFRPYVLFPDIPSFLENLGITRTGRDTTDVLNRKGVLAAVIHYFDGHWGALAVTLPLILFAGLLYLFGFGEVLRRLITGDFMTVLLFLLLAEYYLFLPGSVPMPRYQLPALPFLCVMTASLLHYLTEKSRKIREFFRVMPEKE